MDDLPLSIPANPPPATPPPAPDPSQKRRVVLAAGLALIWGIFTLLAQITGALNTFEEPSLDWRQSLTAYPVPPSDQLALIAIDAIPTERPWPWSRLDYTLALRGIIDYAPQSVVFEMNLNDRDTQYNSFDDAFSHVIQRANTVVFASTLMSQKTNAPPPANLVALTYHGDSRYVARYNSALWPLDTFAGASPVGANNLETESGLRLRRLPMVYFFNGKLVPSLVLQATAQFLGADLASSDIQIGRAIFLQRKDGHLLRTIPIDDQGRLRVRFREGPTASWRASFDNIVVFSDQMRNGIKPGQDLRQVAKRQVWIGRTDKEERKRFGTAVGTLSAVEIQMQAVRTILDQDYVRPLPPIILVMLYLLIGIGGATLTVRFGPIHAAAMFITFALFWLESSTLAFRLYNVILPLPSAAMLLLGCYAVGLLALYWDLEPETDPRQLPLQI